MESILKLGADLIVWLQSLGSWTVKPMEFLSFLGAEEFFLMVAPAVFWCWNAGLGLRLGLFLMVGASINHAFKVIFHGPRPYWADIRVHGLAVETSFGIPSGHASNAMVVWGTLAAYLRKRLWWIAAGIVIFLIGLSRLALGMHYPHDVLIGWLMGGLILLGLQKAIQPVSEWLKAHNLYMKLGAAFAGSLSLIILGVLTQWITANYYLPSEWIDNAVATHPDTPIAPFAISGLFTNAGAFFGLAAGAILLEHVGGFSTRGKWWQLMLRYLLGVAGVLAIRYGLGAIFPGGEELGPYLLRYLRYTLIGLWVTGLAPYLFIKLNLATGRSNQPHISVAEESKAESAI